MTGTLIAFSDDLAGGIYPYAVGTGHLLGIPALEGDLCIWLVVGL